ncbi:63 kDa globulin-like protein [Oryza brachyantha]|uniref:63 kDa globulin-like protein n=1 Tax=Oryza brachyantha TaxID=4533 RepID=UPI001ADB6B0D|nr:63 kDa globulin-like protein [Oryza brachyantha]
MATRARAMTLVLLAAVLFAAAAAAASREDRRGETSLGRCLQRCEEDRPRYERARCVQECKEQQQQQEQERRREHGRHDDDRNGRDRRGGRSSSEEEEDERQQGRRGRPYVFGRRSFRQVVSSDQGSVRLLPPFHQASRLLRGIKNYRVAVLEANPRSFVVPSHTDAHCVCYVAQGEGVVAMIENGERRSYAIRQGDIFVAPAGTINYLANTDGRRKLIVTKILHTISVPGKIQFFFGAGGRNPESFLSSFSKRVQRAAFKISDERLEKLLGKQDKGVIIRASEEQVRELRRHASEGGHGSHWPLPPFGESSRGPFNILEQRPRFANRHGRLYEADARSFHDLAEHDIRVALVNITAGSMNAPFYNTRSVKVAYVLDGEGEAEIVCPHLSRGGEESEGRRGKGKWREEEEEEGQQQEEEEQVGKGYETIRGRLSRGSVIVVPAGHPIVVSSSRDSTLQIVCFDVHAENNERMYLAGTNSVLKKLDAQAKELAFATSAREVDELLNAQQESAFVAGPEESGRRGEQEDEGRHRGRGGEAVETFLRMAAGAV